MVRKLLLRGHAQGVHQPSNQTHKSRRRGHLDVNGKLNKIIETQQDMFQFTKPSDNKTELNKLKDGKKMSGASSSSFFRRANQLYRKGMSELLRIFPLHNSLLRYLQVLHLTHYRHNSSAVERSNQASCHTDQGLPDRRD